ncbi:hypothetical protein [Thermogemmatispora sp.]|uniref:hypothetical protein n=1 Tax=Thermogemmatispora sp. TaxID=1968838 RepID=UPI0035E40FE3
MRWLPEQLQPFSNLESGTRQASTVEAMRTWTSASKPLDVVFPITSLLILGAGLAMTIGFWGWTRAWIDLSLGLLVLLSFVGAAFNGAHARRIAQRSQARAESSDALDIGDQHSDARVRNRLSDGGKA